MRDMHPMVEHFTVKHGWWHRPRGLWSLHGSELPGRGASVMWSEVCILVDTVVHVGFASSSAHDLRLCVRKTNTGRRNAGEAHGRVAQVVRARP